MNLLIQLKTTPPLLIALALLGFALLPKAQAVVPPPDGGYPNFTTAEGTNALQSLTTGSANTAVGWHSLFSNAEGSFNTATGTGALLFNTADQNTAFGGAALLFNTTGHDNTAVGAAALLNNTEGDFNTAVGERALHNNTTGDFNTVTGRDALYSNTTGDSNTANGLGALFLNTEGGSNTAIGVNALLANMSGDNNTTLGRAAGSFINGSGNVCIGEGVSGETGVDDRTYIRNVNTLTQNFSAGVNDYVTVRLSDGRLGHTAVVSSQRYKEDIKPLDKTSQALHALKPVSFRLKREFDPTQALGFGLIAEEVERVNPDLVYRNARGQVESVRYEMVNAMLLNEFLKEHRKVEQLTRDFESKLAKQEKQIDALTAGLQKVSAQLEASKPVPQVAENNSVNAQRLSVKYWEILADNLKKAGWSLGYVSAIDANGRTKCSISIEAMRSSIGLPSSILSCAFPDSLAHCAESAALLTNIRLPVYYSKGTDTAWGREM